MVDAVVDTSQALIAAAVEQVKRLQNAIPRIADGAIELPPFSLPDTPAAGKLVLSKEVGRYPEKDDRTGRPGHHLCRGPGGRLPGLGRGRLHRRRQGRHRRVFGKANPRL